MAQNKVHEEYVDKFRKQVGPVPVEVYNLMVAVGDNDYKVQDILELAIDKAASKATSAAYSGDMNYGGASVFVEAIQAWVAGLSGTIPETREFSRLAVELTKKYNPDDWNEYQRLKKVFGDA